MGRFTIAFSAILVSLGVVVGTFATAQAATLTPKAQQQGKVIKVLTLPQRADLLNRMAIHNALKGDASRAAHFFLRSFHMSRAAKDKKRAIRAIANLKKLEKKYGRKAMLKKGGSANKFPKPEMRKPVKPYNMPDWRTSHEA